MDTDSLRCPACSHLCNHYDEVLRLREEKNELEKQLRLFKLRASQEPPSKGTRNIGKPDPSTLLNFKLDSPVSDPRVKPLFSIFDVLVEELSKLTKPSPVVINFLRQFILSLTPPGNYLGLFTQVFTMWIYSMKVSTPVWDVLHNFGLIATRSWAVDVATSWLENEVFQSPTDPLVCRVNISDNAQLVNSVSYQTSEKKKEYTHFVNRIEIGLELLLEPGIKLFESEVTLDPLKTPLLFWSISSQMNYANTALYNVLDSGRELGLHTSPEKKIKKTKFFVEVPEIPCQTSKSSDMEKLFCSFKNYYLDKLKAEVLILIGDQQLYVQFCKFKRQYELQDSVLVIPGMFHWIAHLCLAICQLLDEWLFRPIVNDLGRSLLMKAKFTVKHFNNWEQFLLQMTEALKEIIIPKYRESRCFVRTIFVCRVIFLVL